jgi:hypothetical protein
MTAYEEDITPALAEHAPGLPPPLKGQPGEVQVGSVRVKLRP